MKFNWGYKILLVYLVFVAGILYLVVQSSKQSVDLVTPDYYAQELKYQEKIDQRKRAEALSGPVRYQVSGHQLEVVFPEEFTGKTIDGELLLYYPANSNKDLRKPIRTRQNAMTLELPKDSHGMHILQVSWIVDGITYYFEENLFLP